MVGSLLWRRNSCVSCALIPGTGHLADVVASKGASCFHVAYREGAGPDLVPPLLWRAPPASLPPTAAQPARRPNPLVSCRATFCRCPSTLRVNICGNTVNVIGLLNPAFGNTCANG